MTQKCIYTNCSRYATYNNPGEKKRIYCNEHKKDNMVDVAHKRCIYSNCKAQPTYNIPGEKKRLYCKEHKLEGMIDVVHKKCEYEGCDKRPTYNEENEKQPLFCKKHKKENMTDIANKKCKYEGCNKQPIYNEEGNNKRLYCKDHKKENMIDVINKRCAFIGCLLQPSYNYEDIRKRLYCKDHKKENMVDACNRRCKNNCDTIVVHKKYKGYCLFCFIHLFPDEKVCYNYKTKEKHITDHIKEQFKEYNWICDKSIQGGCSRRRPDMFIELDEQCIIVEIDENQHNDYDCSCENKRLMELSQDVGHKPIVFIRFNPDDYLDNNINITSCWIPGKDGILRIKNNKVKEWKDRLNTLKQQIEYWTNPENTTNKTVEIIHLFYDKE